MDSIIVILLLIGGYGIKYLFKGYHLHKKGTDFHGNRITLIASAIFFIALILNIIFNFHNDLRFLIFAMGFPAFIILIISVAAFRGRNKTTISFIDGPHREAMKRLTAVLDKHGLNGSKNVRIINNYNVFQIGFYEVSLLLDNKIKKEELMKDLEAVHSYQDPYVKRKAVLFYFAAGIFFTLLFSALLIIVIVK